MTKEEKRRQTLDRIKEYMSKQWTNTFNCEMKISEKDGNLIFDCGFWVVKLGIEDDWFNVSTRKHCGIGFYDLDQIVEIKDNRDTILEIYKDNMFNNLKTN